MNATITAKNPKLIDTVLTLNTLLSNYQIYYQNLRNYHWNIKGRHFFDLHNKFEELYNEAKTSIDEIAERILTLGHRPYSSLSEYLDTASLQEKSGTDAVEMVNNILIDQQELINNMQKLIKIASDANDEGTIDLISGYLASIEKNKWMLNAWIN